MPVRFSDGGSNTINLQNPDRGNRQGGNKRQVLRRSAGGTTYCYTKGIEGRNLELVWSNLREVEKEDLYWFWREIADGAMNSFYYTDHQGNIRTCRFLNVDIDMEEADDDFDTNWGFVAQGTAYPSSRRKNGVWRTGVMMEIESGVS